MKLKKMMKLFLLLFLISLSITIGLFIAMKKTPVSQETVTATVISSEKAYVKIGGVRRSRYIVTIRYNGHDEKFYLSNPYYPMQQVQAYISPDGTLALSEMSAQTNSKAGKMYFVFLAITGVFFIAFIVVYDKIWRVKHAQKNGKAF